MLDTLDIFTASLSRDWDPIQNLGNNPVRGQPFQLRLWPQNYPVSEDSQGHVLDVVWNNKVPTPQGSQTLTCSQQGYSSPRANS